MHYFQHNIADYRKDTLHLSLLEHGIYRQLLDSYYLDEMPLCVDLAKLMRSHSVRSSDEQEALKNVLSDFFELTEKGYIHKRCDLTIAAYHGKSDKAKASAMVRWGNKHKGDDANALPTQYEGNANHKPLTNNHKPITNIKAICTESKIPPCPHDKILEIYHRVLPELPVMMTWNATRQANLRQRWRECFTDWECKDSDEAVKFFEQQLFGVIKDSSFLMGKTNSKDRRPFLATLDWIIKPTNFAKITEGKYS